MVICFLLTGSRFQLRIQGKMRMAWAENLLTMQRFTIFTSLLNSRSLPYLNRIYKPL